jgi:hypothetical protein
LNEAVGHVVLLGCEPAVQLVQGPVHICKAAGRTSFRLALSPSSLSVLARKCVRMRRCTYTHIQTHTCKVGLVRLDSLDELARGCEHVVQKLAAFPQVLTKHHVLHLAEPEDKMSMATTCKLQVVMHVLTSTTLLLSTTRCSICTCQFVQAYLQQLLQH